MQTWFEKWKCLSIRITFGYMLVGKLVGWVILIVFKSWEHKIIFNFFFQKSKKSFKKTRSTQLQLQLQKKLVFMAKRLLKISCYMTLHMYKKIWHLKRSYRTPIIIYRGGLVGNISLHGICCKVKNTEKRSCVSASGRCN